MNNCLSCQKLTKNPKYCSRSCAGHANNILYPKRQKTMRCKSCDDLIYAGFKYCDACRNANKINESTKICDTDQNRIKNQAKSIYKNSKKIKACRICGYNIHYNVAYIKSLNEFKDDALISEVNNINNLVALCPNHYWELEHDIINIK